MFYLYFMYEKISKFLDDNILRIYLFIFSIAFLISLIIFYFAKYNFFQLSITITGLSSILFVSYNFLQQQIEKSDDRINLHIEELKRQSKAYDSTNLENIDFFKIIMAFQDLKRQDSNILIHKLLFQPSMEFKKRYLKEKLQKEIEDIFIKLNSNKNLIIDFFGNFEYEKNDYNKDEPEYILNILKEKKIKLDNKGISQGLILSAYNNKDFIKYFEPSKSYSFIYPNILLIIIDDLNLEIDKFSNFYYLILMASFKTDTYYKITKNNLEILKK